jgi:hypothetical protein
VYSTSLLKTDYSFPTDYFALGSIILLAPEKKDWIVAAERSMSVRSVNTYSSLWCRTFSLATMAGIWRLLALFAFDKEKGAAS